MERKEDMHNGIDVLVFRSSRLDNEADDRVADETDGHHFQHTFSDD